VNQSESNRYAGFVNLVNTPQTLYK
jgi:hypothetical protein